MNLFHQERSGRSTDDPANPESVVMYCMNFAPELAGVGRYTGEIAEYFASKGASVTVVTAPPHYPGWKAHAEYGNRYIFSIESGIRIQRCPLFLREQMVGIWRLIAPLSFALSSAPMVFWQIVRRRPTVVFCVEPTLFAAPVAQIAAKIVGAKTTLHVQDLEVDAAFAVGHLGSKRWLKRLAYVFERAALKRFNRIITISNRMAERLRQKGVADERLSVVRNWVDLSHIYPLNEASPYRSELGFKDDDFVVLYSGNIGVKQDLNVLLDAAKRLHEEKSIHFVVAGEGPAKSKLERLYGHLPNVRFMPFQPYSRLNAFLNMADLHALPQDKGTSDLLLPSKLGGMLASGKPLIVTADTDSELAEFVGVSAIITPPGDAAALAQAILDARAGKYGARDQDVLHQLCLTLARENGLASVATISGVFQLA